MAKKKRKGTRRRRKGAKKRSSGPKAKPLGMAVGLGYGAFDVLATRAPNGYLSPIAQLLASGTIDEKLTNASVALKSAMTSPETYKVPLAGLLITASPRIPLIGIIAKPANKGLKRLTKGKWGL